MKQILNSIIIFSLMLTTFALSSCNSSGTVKSNSADVVLENIATRTSIRAFTGESIDDETITKILKGEKEKLLNLKEKYMFLPKMRIKYFK